MSRFGNTLFKGSRILFWSLAPILILFGVTLPFFIRNWTVAILFLVFLIEGFLIMLVLSLYHPKRFRWATRSVTAILFCLSLAYLIVELLGENQALGGTGSRAEASPQNALLFLIAVGLPCLWYTLFGRFTLRAKRAHHKGETEQTDKLDTLDI